MDTRKIFHRDKDILTGQPVFTGTRVPIESLMDHIEAGISLEDFLEDFPTVSREQATYLLNLANTKSRIKEDEI